MEVRPIFKLHQNGSTGNDDDAANDTKTLQPLNKSTPGAGADNRKDAFGFGKQTVPAQETVEKLTAEEAAAAAAGASLTGSGTSGMYTSSAAVLPSKPMLKIEYKIEREIVMVRTQCIMDFEISRITGLIKSKCIHHHPYP